MIEDYGHILKLAENDVEVLEDKGKYYGSSWRNRGGVGAFMMLARKWDRIENIAEAHGYDIFGAIRKDNADVDGVLDDIQDLRRYLLLVESHVTAPKAPKAPTAPAVLPKAAPCAVHGCSNGAIKGSIYCPGHFGVTSVGQLKE